MNVTAGRQGEAVQVGLDVAVTAEKKEENPTTFAFSDPKAPAGV
jgi:hypothetical protein